MAANGPEKNSIEALKKRLGKLSTDELVMIIYAVLVSMDSNIDEFLAAIQAESARRKSIEEQNG